MSTRKYRLATTHHHDRDNVPLTVRFVPVVTTSLKDIQKTKAASAVEPVAERVIPVKLTNTPRWWFVLPCLLLIIFVSASDPLLMNDFIIRRYERYYGFDSNSGGQNRGCRQPSATIQEKLYWQYPIRRQNDYTRVQRAAASLQTRKSLIALAPTLLIFAVLGSNCDTIGRRPLLVVALFGKVIYYSLMLIITIRDLSDTWLIIAHTIDNSIGSAGLVFLSAFAYITDCTSGLMRVRAFLVTEGIALIVRIVPVVALGIWLRFYRYVVPLSIGLGLSTLALLYALFFQPESVETVRDLSLLRQFLRIRLKPIIRIITVFTVTRPGYTRAQVILITAILVLLQIVLIGYFSIFSLYLYGRPMCLDALAVSLLATTQTISAFILTLLSTWATKRLKKTSFTTVSVVGCCALTTNLLIFSFAKRLWLFYLAVAIGGLFFIVMPVLRTRLTKLIQPHEYAMVFVGAGIIETLGQSLMAAAANAIYNASLSFFPGLVFSVFAAIGLIPIVLIGCIAFMQRKKSTQRPVGKLRYIEAQDKPNNQSSKQ